MKIKGPDVGEGCYIGLGKGYREERFCSGWIALNSIELYACLAGSVFPKLNQWMAGWTEPTMTLFSDGPFPIVSV